MCTLNVYVVSEANTPEWWRGAVIGLHGGGVGAWERRGVGASGPVSMFAGWITTACMLVCMAAWGCMYVWGPFFYYRVANFNALGRDVLYDSKMCARS